MAFYRTGRNDLCLCGSGKKYKKCCLGKQDTGITTEESGKIFADNYMQQRNKTGINKFQGLSPEQMHRFLYFPLSSPDIVTFPERLSIESEAPIIVLFNLLVEGIGERGLKATAKGNLPRSFCQEAAQVFWGEAKYRERIEFMNINKEDDFSDLNTTRLVAAMAGLIRKSKGKYILSKVCRKLLTEHGVMGIYPRLLKAYISEFNWAYQDRYPEIDFIQHSFLYTLYLLTKFGDDWQLNKFYEDCFLQAFPEVMKEAPQEYSWTPEEQVRSCYQVRTLVRFAGFFGIAAVEPVSKNPFNDKYRVKKLPLLHEAVQFKLG